MTDPNDFFWFRLSRLPGVGPKTLWKVQRAAAARSLPLPELLTDASGPAAEREVCRIQALLAEQDADELEVELSALAAHRVSLLHPDHAQCPAGVLEHGVDFGLPPLLFARGHLPIARSAGVAIVGSRTIEPDGVEFAQQLSEGLAVHGLNIVSRYARGADMAGHTGALRAGGTTTIALGLGILNFEAKSEIKPLLTATNTLILSQFHPRARWMARNAMASNKLACALSRAIVVITSGPELDDLGRASGTFDTARTGLAMGIPVFVLSPQALRNPPPGNAALIQMGCTELLPDGAMEQIHAAIADPRPHEHEPQPQNALL
ncbi:MAG TPA: DNA-processing protein DprA [Longimicrobium sp.]|nr:DNA-processing protein DprA [Longimicrobium sp.]